MVDPVSNSGSVGGIQSTQKTRAPDREDDKKKTDRTEEPRDEVRISQEARDAQAKQEAEDARRKLEEDRSATLGLDRGFDQQA